MNRTRLLIAALSVAFLGLVACGDTTSVHRRTTTTTEHTLDSGIVEPGDQASADDR